MGSGSGSSPAATASSFSRASSAASPADWGSASAAGSSAAGFGATSAAGSSSAAAGTSRAAARGIGAVSIGAVTFLVLMGTVTFVIGRRIALLANCAAATSKVSSRAVAM